MLAVILAVLTQSTDSDMVPAYMEAQIRALVSAPSKLEPKRARQELMGALGLSPLPPKTPLNAKVTGRLERDGYVIDKVVYETFPRFYATAYLYLPTGAEKPCPAVLCPVGHWSKKKLEPVVQARCIGLALLGFAVLCIDMPGFVGDNDDERNFPGSHSDWVLHMSSLPPAGVMVWDVVRGIDYLETRPEVDASRIGCTGASGGGLTTMYAAAVEPRIKCYTPVCYPTSYEDNYDNGCLCNHVPGVMLLGDRADVMALAGPKPVLLIGAETDPEFPKAGTLRSHEKLLKHYADAADCQVFIAAGGHDYCKPMRERMYGFMLKHLMGKGDGGPAPEPRGLPADRNSPAVNVEQWGDPKALCFPGGKAPEDARSLRDLALEKARKLAADPALDVPPDRLLPLLRQRARRIYPSPERVALDVQLTGMVERGVAGTYVSEPGLRIPFTLTIPGRGKQPARIIFSEKGLADTGARVSGEPAIEMRIDGRGLGSIPGLEMRLATYVGRPDVWMWAWDVSRAVDYLRSRDDVGEIEVWGFGPAGGQVALLAALLDERIARAHAGDTLDSYLDCFQRTDLPRFAMPHRILEVADLSTIRKALGVSE
jgi:dienelactone hydrolase